MSATPDWVLLIPKEVFTVAVDRISYPGNEYVVMVSTLQRLCDIAKKTKRPLLIVGNRLAVVIDPQPVPIRYVWIEGGGRSRGQ